MITNPPDDSTVAPASPFSGAVTNPHLAILDRSWAQLPDDTKDVVNRTHELLGLRGVTDGASAMETAADQPPNAPTAPQRQVSANPPLSGISNPEENLLPGMVGVRPKMLTEAPANSSPTAPETPLPMRTQRMMTSPTVQTPAQQNYSRLTAPPITSGPMAHTPEDTGRAGAGQIKSAWGRVPLQILDAVGSGLFPRIAQFIPGTEAHHGLEVVRAANAVGEENAQQKAQRESDEAQARIGHEGAQSKLANQQADTLAEEGKRAPKADLIAVGDGLYDAKQGKWIKEPSDKDKDKLIAVDADYGKTHHLTPSADGKYYIPHEAVSELLKPPTVKEGQEPLGERIGGLNQAMTARYQVLHPGAALPAHYQLPANATKADFDRTEKLLQGEESAFGNKENHEQTNEFRRQTAALAAGNREHKEETSLKQATHKAFTPALDSAERFNVMAKNYEDAVKNHDQQAMLSLLANHIGMTMGLQKGARINQHMYVEAANSLPWLKRIGAKFDSDGILSGVTLDPTQMQQMVNLGRERFSEDVKKGRNESKYLGATDDGPDREPSKSTVSQYLNLANGDKAKAKALLSEDGWSVK